MEYRFNCGNYRHFTIQADNEQQAKDRFEETSKMSPSPNYGFQLKDVASIRERKMNKYEGNDNYGKPKSDYLTRLTTMTDKELRDACEQMIWLSAYAGNNPRSDYHWQCGACFDECSQRDKKHIYEQAHKYVSSSV